MKLLNEILGTKYPIIQGGMANITTGELLEVLTATKTAVVPTYRSGRPITYLITLVNAGTADLTGLAVADDLGGYTFNGATVYPLAMFLRVLTAQLLILALA